MQNKPLLIFFAKFTNAIIGRSKGSSIEERLYYGRTRDFEGDARRDKD